MALLQKVLMTLIKDAQGNGSPPNRMLKGKAYILSSSKQRLSHLTDLRVSGRAVMLENSLHTATLWDATVCGK